MLASGYLPCRLLFMRYLVVHRHNAYSSQTCTSQRLASLAKPASTYSPLPSDSLYLRWCVRDLGQCVDPCIKWDMSRAVCGVCQ